MGQTRPNPVSARLRTAHHGVGGFFVDFELTQRVGDKEDVHGISLGFGCLPFP